jgi:tripeptide aminopeptidase
MVNVTMSVLIGQRAPWVAGLVFMALLAFAPITPDANATPRVEPTIDLADPALVAAFQYIAEQEPEINVARLIELNQIPAPPFAEGPRAEDMARRMTALGLKDVRVDEVGNVVARRPGRTGARTLAVSAHLDTVFPASTDVTVKREGNLFTAPGIGDNTRGLVVMLALIDVLETFQIQTEDDLLFIATVGEEGLGDLRGVRHVFRKDAPKVDGFISIDGGDIDRLVTSAVGSLRYRVMYEGPGGHSYGAFGRANPHNALAGAIGLFTEAATPITLDGPKATYNIGVIGGGTSVNSIPFESWMEVDMRSGDPRKLDALDRAFLAAVEQALVDENTRRTIGDPLTVRIEPIGNRPAGEGDPKTSLVRNSVAALKLMGIEAQLTASSTDSNIPIWLGIPAITISRGGISRNAHAPDESWESVDPEKGAQTLLLIVLMEAGWVR